MVSEFLEFAAQLSAALIKTSFFKRYRSSHQGCSVRKGVLVNLAKFTRKHLCQSLFFNKVAGLRPATLLKKRLWHRYFPVNFVKFLRIPFSQNASWRLLLKVLFVNFALTLKYLVSKNELDYCF